MGQLLKLREALSSKTMVFVDERDAELLRDDNGVDTDPSGSDNDENAKSWKGGGAGAQNDEGCTGTAASGGSGGGEAVGLGGKVDRVRNRVRLATVDNFQGEESMVVILSLVRNQPSGRIGFLRLPNRVNVMLSRAMHGMYILGHSASLTRDRTSPMWPAVLDLLHEAGAVGHGLPLRCPNHPATVTHVSTPEEFEALAGDGGCTRQVREALGLHQRAVMLRCWLMMRSIPIFDGMMPDIASDHFHKLVFICFLFTQRRIPISRKKSII